VDKTEYFERLGNSPERWRSIAEALVYNAEVLTRHRHDPQRERHHYEETQTIAAVDMCFGSLILWGYALESLFKCLYLKEGGRLTEKGKYTACACWKKHQLVPMAKAARFPLSSAQQRVLEHLSTITKWSGRYPIDTVAEGTCVSHWWAEPEDDQIVEDVVKALRLAIRGCCQAG
jgi:hypothetical protein